MKPSLSAVTLLTALMASGCGGKSEADAKQDSLVNDPADPVASADDTTAVGGNPSTNDLPDQADSGEHAPQEMICNGSDASRFVFVQGGGFVGAEFKFTGLYGSRFLVIDGQCNFWLGTDGMAGLRTGHLDPSEGETLSERLQYGRYETVAQFQGQACPDAGGTYLSDGTARLLSLCAGSADGAPEVWERAFMAVFQEWQDLHDRAKPSWGPTSLLVVESQAPGANPVPWSVNVKLEPLAITFDELSGERVDPLGTLIEVPETLEQLGQFRMAALKADEYTRGVTVDDSGSIYDVYVRDELPAKVATALVDVQRN